MDPSEGVKDVSRTSLIALADVWDLNLGDEVYVCVCMCVYACMSVYVHIHTQTLM